MIISRVENYLYSTDINYIDTVKLTEHCLQIEKYLADNLPDIELDWYGNKTSAHNNRYNIFTFAGKEINELYYAIKDNVSQFLDVQQTYMIKGWLNVYSKGQFVDWHGHWPKEAKVWHGFFCVQTGDYISSTCYKVPGVKDIIEIPSIEGRLVFGKSEGDEHKSSKWLQDYPRITIAFDIIPIDSIKDKTWGNHFIPFKL